MPWKLLNLFGAHLELLKCLWNSINFFKCSQVVLDTWNVFENPLARPCAHFKTPGALRNPLKIPWNSSQIFETPWNPPELPEITCGSWNVCGSFMKPPELPIKPLKLHEKRISCFGIHWYSWIAPENSLICLRICLGFTGTSLKSLMKPLESSLKVLETLWNIFENPWHFLKHSWGLLTYPEALGIPWNFLVPPGLSFKPSGMRLKLPETPSKSFHNHLLFPAKPLITPEIHCDPVNRLWNP